MLANEIIRNIPVAGLFQNGVVLYIVTIDEIMCNMIKTFPLMTSLEVV